MSLPACLVRAPFKESIDLLPQMTNEVESKVLKNGRLYKELESGLLKRDARSFGV